MLQELASLIIESNERTITAPPPQEQQKELPKETVPTRPVKRSKWDKISWP
jgi:hypothetical protein